MRCFFSPGCVGSIMAPASLEFITWETIPTVVETQVVFPANLILGGIRKEKTMKPADRNLGMDRPISRHELFSTSFETIESAVRRQLVGSLSEGGFDPARDIEAITVNRWAHGYLDWGNPLFDEEYEDDDDDRYTYVRGRKPFGRITIANSDAGSTSLLDVAINEAHRAVHELG